MASVIIKKPNGKFTDKIISILIKKYQDGIKVSELVKKYGISKCSIRYLLKINGIDLGRDIKRLPLTEKETKTLIKEFRDGDRVKSICKKYNLSVSGVSKILHRNKIQLRYDGKPIKQDTLDAIIMCKIGGMTGVQISKKLGTKASNTRANLHYHGYKLGRKVFYRYKHSLNDDYFSIIDSDEKAYFLGLLFADGNVCNSADRINIYLQEKDGYIIRRFKKCLSFTGKLCKKVSKKPNHSNQIYINVSSKRIKEDLAKLGCVPRKARILKFPIIDDKYFWSFFRGYFDGDGCISVKKSKFGIVSRRIMIVSCIDFNLKLKAILLDKYGIASSISRRYERCSCLTISRKDCIDLIYESIYKNATVFMKRKKNKFYA